MEAINQIEITLPPNQVKQILRTLLYAIFFQRTLESVEPSTHELLEAHIAAAVSPAIEKEVGEKLEEFGRKYLEGGSGAGFGSRIDKGEIALIFTQKRPRKGWFGITEELVPWEAHFITVHFAYPSVSRPRPRHPFILSDTLIRILTFCAERGYSVPNVPPSEADRLSHQILVSPPPPSDLFAPSPPLPARSPPPIPTTTTTTTTALAHVSLPPGSAADEVREMGAAAAAAIGGGGSRRASSSASPSHALSREGREGREGRDGAMGYLDHAKDVLRATGARAGAVTGWTGRGR